MKHYLNIIFSVLFFYYISQSNATELTSTNKLSVEKNKKLYQLDVILFYYTDLALENMIPRILPLNKNFTANKIISLSSADHPLNQITKAQFTETNDIIINQQATKNIEKLATNNIPIIKPSVTSMVADANIPNNLRTNVTVSTEALTDQQILSVPIVNSSEINGYSDKPTANANSEIISAINFINNENKNDASRNLLILKDPDTVSTLKKLNSKQNEAIVNIDNNQDKIVINQPTEIQFDRISIANSEINTDNNMLKSSPDKTIENILATTEFIELPETNYLLNNEFNKISADENINLIGYKCWRMPIEKTTKVVLEPAISSNSFKQFQAEISCKKNNLGKILITADMYFNISISDLKNLNKNDKIIAYKKQHKYYDPYLYHFFSYEFKTNIKNSEKLIYLDSPVIGILIKITQVN